MKIHPSLLPSFAIAKEIKSISANPINESGIMSFAKSAYPERIRYCPGMRFANFVLIGQEESKMTSKGRCYTQWNCLCDCGVTFIKTTKQIKRGIVKSCGCKSKSSRYRKLRTDPEVIYMRIMSHYRVSARNRTLAFDLTLDECIRLITGSCNYCGVPPCRQVAQYAGTRRLVENPQLTNLLVNGIDRIDSSAGYIAGNMISCCHICNRAKREMKHSDFMEWIARLTAFHSQDHD